MGELKLDLDHLRTTATAVRDAAEHIAEIAWPQLDPDAMHDSSVSSSTAPVAIATRTTDLTARMQTWAADARTSAAAFEHTESVNTERLDR